MSFATMSMGNEMPEQDILEKFSDLEDQTINGSTSAFKTATF